MVVIADMIDLPVVQIYGLLQISETSVRFN